MKINTTIFIFKFENKTYIYCKMSYNIIVSNKLIKNTTYLLLQLSQEFTNHRKNKISILILDAEYKYNDSTLDKINKRITQLHKTSLETYIMTYLNDTYIYEYKDDYLEFINNQYNGKSNICSALLRLKNLCSQCINRNNKEIVFDIIFVLSKTHEICDEVINILRTYNTQINIITIGIDISAKNIEYLLSMGNIWGSVDTIDNIDKYKKVINGEVICRNKDIILFKKNVSLELAYEKYTCLCVIDNNFVNEILIFKDNFGDIKLTQDITLMTKENTQNILVGEMFSQHENYRRNFRIVMDKLLGDKYPIENIFMKFAIKREDISYIYPHTLKFNHDELSDEVVIPLYINKHCWNISKILLPYALENMVSGNAIITENTKKHIINVIPTLIYNILLEIEQWQYINNYVGAPKYELNLFINTMRIYHEVINECIHLREYIESSWIKWKNGNRTFESIPSLSVFIIQLLYLNKKVDDDFWLQILEEYSRRLISNSKDKKYTKEYIFTLLNIRDEEKFELDDTLKMIQTYNELQKTDFIINISINDMKNNYDIAEWIRTSLLDLSEIIRKIDILRNFYKYIDEIGGLKATFASLDMNDGILIDEIYVLFEKLDLQSNITYEILKQHPLNCGAMIAQNILHKTDSQRRNAITNKTYIYFMDNPMGIFKIFANKKMQHMRMKRIINNLHITDCENIFIETENLLIAKTILEIINVRKGIVILMQQKTNEIKMRSEKIKLLLHYGIGWKPSIIERFKMH